MVLVYTNSDPYQTLGFNASACLKVMQKGRKKAFAVVMLKGWIPVRAFGCISKAACFDRSVSERSMANAR
ncbi:hypothetical protein C5O19_24505 [Siphonobacter curvatus]|uniref:Uncharacterized protein n=1 Tax=Siphonobacter curvatus TaxID=2094562 RepID=A0A2S7IF42_9BACT|nr:hypothetical protein C5O19_24505 [Siphonobacter curvatus]